MDSRMPFLGPLEQEVMDAVWKLSAANVRDVVGQMERPLAYTTVMTTLDRLYKKGLLSRETTERAFLYSPKLTPRGVGPRAGRSNDGGLPGGACQSRAK